ncbi:hypothetical protein PI124_g9540 [Phytophthora idaei]|nr:hypothetical protein PI125_g9187 [Phytophthora idaei]KAG3157214.1 hypothetical protein PI126_g8415 [Phytophthora idaei]KAG3245699.1 hypothetical protein PI124_g9540 [Phytophthora idaei]
MSHWTDEERAITYGQYLASLKLPKFSKLPGIKQLDKIRLYLCKKVGKACMARMKKRYESTPNNFM